MWVTCFHVHQLALSTWPRLICPRVVQGFSGWRTPPSFVLMGHGCTICLILVQKRKEKAGKTTKEVRWLDSLDGNAGPSALQQPMISYYSFHRVIANLMTSPQGNRRFSRWCKRDSECSRFQDGQLNYSRVTYSRCHGRDFQTRKDRNTTNRGAQTQRRARAQHTADELSGARQGDLLRMCCVHSACEGVPARRKTRREKAAPWRISQAAHQRQIKVIASGFSWACGKAIDD